MTIATGQPMLASDILNLTFFPKGAILTFSSEAWNVASTEFKNIWKICNGQNGTPNLVGRFLRGGESSNFTTPGGADSQTVAVPLPKHNHRHTHSNHQGEFNCTYINVINPSGVFTAYGNGSEEGTGHHNGGRVVMNADHSYDETSAGVDNANITVPTVPSYYTVIYIMKVA
jgi:hypothetical protein